MESRIWGVYTLSEKRERAIRKEWEQKATEKNNRIVAVGYAERQIADSLKRAGKIDTKI